MVPRHLALLLLAALAALLSTGAAIADHRPGDVIVLGGTFSLSGRFAQPSGRFLNACKLYVEQMNNRGGLLGRQVVLKAVDDKSDRRTAIELYEKLITEHEVDLFLGPFGGHLTDAVANVMERYKRPFIAFASARVIWERGRKYVFSIPTAPAQDYQKGALHIAKEMGIKRVVVIGEGSFFPRQATEGAVRWAKELGLDVVFIQSYRKGETDFTALLKKIGASGAEAIFSNSLYADSVAQLRQMRALNINVKMFAATVGPALPKFTEELGDTAEFTLGFSQWEPRVTLGYPGMKEFIEAYEQRYGVKPNYHASGAYTVVQILEAAVKHAGSLDPQKVRDALASIEVETIRGLYKPDAQGMSIRESLTFQIQKGERVIVWPKDKAEAKYILPMPRWDERPKH